ncbi:MAG TPA: hypothetical protein VM509_03795, partial [Planctomycetota bacterium]|nr:hypothetical protein [Planctomycetota bacterium]
SGGKRLGKIQLLGEATLYADATGRTNLDNALEPREAPKEEKQEPKTAEDSASLKELDVELDVLITKIYWADEHTRELGAPFVLENVSLAAVLHPDQPMTAKVRGTLTGGSKSDLSFDARVEHPFDAPSSSTPPRAEISAEVAHFPTPLLDAVTRQGGRLQSLLGDELSLQLTARGTVEQGSFDLKVDSPHGQVRGAARLAKGILHSEDTGLAAEFDVHQEFVDMVARPLLAGGRQLTRLAPPAGANPSSSRIVCALSSFEAPIGAYLEASAKGHAAEGLDALLAGTRARWTSNLGDWVLRDPETLAGRSLTVRGLALGGELNAPAESSKLELSFSAAVDDATSTPTAGHASVSLTFSGGATLAKFTPSAALAPVQARVKLAEVPTALFDSLAGLGGDLTRALGPSLALDVDATTSIEAATNPDLTWSNIGTRWRELAARISETATIDLRGSPTGEPLKSLGDQALSVRAANGRLALAPGQPLEAFAQLDFETPAVGHLDFTASLGELFAAPSSKTPLRFSIASKANGLPAKAFDALAGSEKPLLQPLLGNLLAFDATVQGTLEEGVARIDFSSEKSQVLLVGRLQNGMFVNMNEPVLSVSLQPDASLFDELVAAHLPPGSKLAFADSRGVVGVNVNFLALPVAELLETAKKSTSDALALALSKTRLDAIVGLREFTYSDEALAATGQRIDHLALRLDVELRPGDKGQPTPLTLDFTATSPSWGENPVELHAVVPHAPDLLAITTGADFAPIVARLHAAQLPTALLDAYAGNALHEPLGPKLDLTLDLQCSQLPKQPFAADGNLELSAAGGKSSIRFGAQVVDPFDREVPITVPPSQRAVGVLRGLDATLDVSGAGSLLAFAPASARDLLRGLCGDQIAAKVKLAANKPGAKEVDLVLDAGGLALSGTLTYIDRNLSTKESKPLVLKVAPSQATLDQLLADKLPAGASLKLAGTANALVVQITNLHVPLGSFDDADPSLARTELIENLDGQVDATLPPFTYTHPQAADGTAGAVVTVREVELHSRMKPRGPATIDVTGHIEATPPGGIELHVVVEKPAGFVVEPPAVSPAPGSRARLDAKLTRFPSALLDLLAKQEGLLVDVLGPELEASVRGEYPDAGGEPLHAEMHSNLGDIALVSRIEKGVVISEGDQGLDAKVGLTPLFSKRIVGSLVPMLVEVKQDDASKRTLLTGRKLTLPMDGDLSKLSGDLVLDLGAVDYQLLPTLSQALSLTGKEFGEKNAVIPPITIQIVDGVARYDRIPIKISGREVNFHGSANLVNKNFELAFAVPLEMLGSKVEAELERVRKYLDPKLEVPLEIYGSWKSPKLRLGKGFLEKAAKDALRGGLEGELEKGLGDLFGGGKKKPKKDG